MIRHPLMSARRRRTILVRPRIGNDAVRRARVLAAAMVHIREASADARRMLSEIHDSAKVDGDHRVARLKRAMRYAVQRLNEIEARTRLARKDVR